MMQMFCLFMVYVSVLRAAVGCSIEYACWRDLDDDARTLLLGECWTRCDYDISTPQGLEWLLQETEIKLQRGGMDPPRMALAVKGICADYVERAIAERKFPNGWVKSPQDFYDLAADFFPDDQNKQAICVLYTMAYYTECSGTMEGGSSMFMRPDPPVKEEWLGERYFTADSEVMSACAYAISNKTLYLLRNDYIFSFLDFVVAMRHQWQLAVFIHNWRKRVPVHKGNYSSFFEIVFQHDHEHGFMGTYFDVVMDLVDPKFSERKSKVTELVLRKQWRFKGPQMLVGGFFALHEAFKSLLYVSGRRFFRAGNAMGKISDVLLGGCDRGVIDQGLYDVVEAIFPNRSMDEGGRITMLHKIARNFVLQFIQEYRIFSIEQQGNPRDIVTEEWLQAPGGLAEVLQVICDYVARCSGVPKVAIIGGYAAINPQYIPLRKPGYVCFSVHLGTDAIENKEQTVLVPTQQVVDSFTFPQKQQMVEAFEVYDRYHIIHYLIKKVRDLSITTKSLVEQLPVHIQEKIFGRHLAEYYEIGGRIPDWDIAKTPGVFFRQSVINRQYLRLNNYPELTARKRNTVEDWRIYLSRHHGQLGDMAFIILTEFYIQSKEAGNHDRIEKFLEEGMWPSEQDVMEYCVKEGEPLVNSLSKWRPNVRSYVFTSSELSLFDRVNIEACRCYAINLEGDLLSQCEAIYQRASNEHKACRFISCGSRYNYMDNIRNATFDRVKQSWRDVGVLHMIGLELVRENLVFPEALSYISYGGKGWKYVLSTAIKNTVVKPHTVLEAIVQVNPSLQSSTPLCTLPHQLMYLACAEGLKGSL